MRLPLRFIPFVLLLCLFAAPAYAACSNPSGNEGAMIYNADYHTVQFCNGTDWIQAGGGTTALSGLSDVNVSGVTGGQALVYDSASSKWVPGNGDNLGNHTATQDLNMSGYNIAGAADVGATTGTFSSGVKIGPVTTCDAAHEGTIRYSSDTVEYCADNSGSPAWTAMGSGGGTIGQSILSGWPDAIYCDAGNGYVQPFYLANKDKSSAAVTYLFPSSGASYSITYDSTGAYSSNSNEASSDCVSNAWSISYLVANGKAFNFVNGGSSAGSMSDGTAGAPGLYFAANTNTGIYRPASNTLAIATGGTEKLRVDASGNVGIGTASPVEALDVNGAVRIGTNATCDASHEGAIRYDTDTIQYCAANSGSPAWTNVGGTVTGGATALSGLSDVSLSSPANNDVLQYNGTNWVNTPAQTAMGTTTMVSNWPDALMCTVTSTGAHKVLYHAGDMVNGGSTIGYDHYFDGDNIGRWISFNADGSFNTSDSTTNGSTFDQDFSNNCWGKSISQLYASGQAFNFIGSSLASAASPSGGVQFNNGSGVLAADSNLYWDNTNKRLGIGTTSPQTALDVNGGIKPGSATTGGACSPEGAFGYDSTAHAPVYCNSSAVWAAVGSGVPSGAVMAFNLSSCPSGWSEYTPAYGRFIRGIDKSGTSIDPDGQRAPGSTQADAFQGHHHSLYYSDQSGSVAATDMERFNNTSNLLGNDFVGDPVSDGVNGTPRTANETRPKNVALLYCEKN